MLLLQPFKENIAICRLLSTSIWRLFFPPLGQLGSPLRCFLVPAQRSEDGLGYGLWRGELAWGVPAAWDGSRARACARGHGCEAGGSLLGLWHHS